MRHSILVGIAGFSLAFVAFLAGPLWAQNQVDIVWTKARPIVAWTGSYSAIEQVQYHRITNTKDWALLWAEHQGNRIERDSYGKPVVPTIDFGTNMVLAIFRGNAWNTRAQLLLEINESDTSLQIRFDAWTYQTSGPAEERDYTRAYGIWVLPRSTKQVTLIENVQGLIGRPSKWKTQHTFDALREN